MERLYEHCHKMLNDEVLSDKDKLALLREWKYKTERKIESPRATSKTITEACAFLAYLSLRRYELEKKIYRG